MTRISVWVRQPTTIAGVAAFAGTISALLLQQVTWAQAIPLLVGAATSIVLPDNSTARNAAQALAQDAVVLLDKAPVATGVGLGTAAQQKSGR